MLLLGSVGVCDQMKGLLKGDRREQTSLRQARTKVCRSNQSGLLARPGYRAGELISVHARDAHFPLDASSLVNRPLVDPGEPR
jgi:hypothetical protein